MNIHTGIARNDIYRQIVMSYYKTTNHDTSTDNCNLQNVRDVKRKKKYEGRDLRTY